MKIRLVDLDALLETLYKYYPEYWDEIMEKFPTVDAVPVVRCKDCRHRDPEDHKCDCGHDILWQLPRDDDWYCADGKRKGGDE